MNEQESNKEIQLNEKGRNRSVFYHFYFNLIFVFLLASGFFFLGFFNGKKQVEKENISLNKEEFFLSKNNIPSADATLFWKAWDTLREKYVDANKLDEKKLFYGAIKGMVDSVGDPYTLFFDPEENKEFSQEISGSFEGIGAELGIKKGMLTIISPLQNSPAQKAGLLPGDKIIKINGEIASEMTIDEAVEKIRGPKNTEVKLTIFRNGDEKSKEITVIRDTIEVKSIEWEMKTGEIAYVKIIRFEEQDTEREFKKAIAEILTHKPKGLILDLRNNPGGYLATATNIANWMVPKGKIVVIEEDSAKNQEKILTEGGDILSYLPTMVLINKGSASASEILAATLRDNRDNVRILGEKSFGKGSVQEFINLPQKTAIKVTVAEWLTPSGKRINNEGIMPDIEVELTYEDYENNRDPQLDKALEIIKQIF